SDLVNLCRRHLLPIDHAIFDETEQFSALGIPQKHGGFRDNGRIPPWRRFSERRAKAWDVVAGFYGIKLRVFLMHIRGLAPQLKKSPHCQNVKRVLALLDESFLFVQWNAAASGKQSDQQRRENRNHDGSHTLERSLVHLEKPFGFRRSRFNRLADITLTKTTKERIGIESGIVTIAPRDLEGISADRFNVHQHNK